MRFAFLGILLLGIVLTFAGISVEEGQGSGRRRCTPMMSSNALVFPSCGITEAISYQQQKKPRLSDPGVSCPVAGNAYNSTSMKAFGISDDGEDGNMMAMLIPFSNTDEVYVGDPVTPAPSKGWGFTWVNSGLDDDYYYFFAESSDGVDASDYIFIQIYNGAPSCCVGPDGQRPKKKTSTADASKTRKTTAVVKISPTTPGTFSLGQRITATGTLTQGKKMRGKVFGLLIDENQKPPKAVAASKVTYQPSTTGQPTTWAMTFQAPTVVTGKKPLRLRVRNLFDRSAKDEKLITVK
jgi:hypothetical protein